MRLRYWIAQGLKTFGLVTAASAIYAFMMLIQMDNLIGGLLTLMPLYLLLFGGMMLMAMNVGVYKLNLPLVLSFGSTRNEAILGLNLFRIIPALLLTTVLSILCTFSSSGDTLNVRDAIPVGLGVYLLFGAVGACIGVIFTKYGKIAAVVTAVALILTGGACGFLAGFADSNSFLANILFSGKMPWLVLCIGLLVYFLAQIPEQRTVWKCNVKL